VSSPSTEPSAHVTAGSPVTRRSLAFPGDPPRGSEADGLGGGIQRHQGGSGRPGRCYG
jgi:hypothetical protein